MAAANNSEMYVSKEDCKNNYDNLISMVGSIDKRLFKDNGSLSVQTRIDRQGQEILLLTKEFDKIRHSYTNLVKNSLDLLIRVMAIVSGMYALYTFLQH